nr:phage tail assembly chaperone [Brevundimonas bacteroides]
MGISPEAFWRLSLKEWRMLTVSAGAASMRRRELDEMMRAWPDDRRLSIRRAGRRAREGGGSGGGAGGVAGARRACGVLD